MRYFLFTGDVTLNNIYHSLSLHALVQKLGNVEYYGKIFQYLTS